MRVAVISELELGSHKAHAINVVKTAGGLARLGHEVTLLCRPGRGGGSADLLRAYGETSLRCELQEERWTPDEAGSIVTGRWAARRAKDIGAEFVFARHFSGAIESADLGLKTVMETHAYVGVVKPILDEALAATARPARPLAGVVTISERLRRHYIERGAAADRVRVVPDGVDLEMFKPRVGDSPFAWGAPNAVYCGHLYEYKGVPTILGAAARRPRVQFHLVGGAPEDLARVRRQVEEMGLGNVTIHGQVEHAAVPRYMWHADVLMLPPSGKDPSAGWTSPVKLGEYLASGAPVVASEIEGLKDWVDAPAVRWFEPDSPEGLAAAIDTALRETLGQCGVRRAAAMALARRFSYPNRARLILAAGAADSDAVSQAA